MSGKLPVGVMVLTCLVPALLVLALPALGVHIGGAWVLLILLYLPAYLLMMRKISGPGHTEAPGQERHSIQSGQEIEAVEGNRETAIESEQSLLPVPAANRLPVPVSNWRPAWSFAG